MKKLNIAMAQIAPTVGDIAGNITLIRGAYVEAAQLGADLVVCPELIVCGYPPEDLVRKGSFQRACMAAVEELAVITQNGPGLIIGAPWIEDQTWGAKPYNGAILLDEGEITAIRYKQCLPNYGVFDEPRRFSAGGKTAPVMFRGVDIGLMVCEDMWLPETAASLKKQGAKFFIVPHGSPYRETAHAERFAAAEARVEETGLPVIFVNQVGGQDELIFDGAAFVLDGKKRYTAPAFATGIYLTKWQETATGWTCVEGPQAKMPDRLEQVYQAVTRGVRDYVNKNHFKSVIIGLSGGVDSALTAAIAVDALGADRVHCVMMPSRYTAGDSVTDAEACAKMLGVQYQSIAIKPAVEAFGEMLAPVFDGLEPDVTEENIQSRVRGVLLMALSNKFGHMVLTTGNKSEMSVGYATLYGDMNGGYNPLKDLYKLDVFALCHWRNQNYPTGLLGPSGRVIPENIITKPPSAELREDQRDDDSLPPYEILDPILENLVENELSVKNIVAKGFDEATVRRIQHLLYVAEYKRRQAAPGPKVTAKNFGRDRRYPITNGYRDKA